MGQTDTYRSFHTTAVGYTFFSSTHETFSWKDHMLGHKNSFTNLRRLKSSPVSFPTTVEKSLKWITKEKEKKSQKHGD